MAQGLTISVVIFILLVLIPGYLRAWASGRFEEARQYLKTAITWGVLIFTLCFLLFLALWPERVNQLFQVLAGDYSNLDQYLLLHWMVILYPLATIIGAVQLAVDARFCLGVKANMAWRRFVVGNQVIETSARHDIFWDILLCYRIIRRRPFVTVHLDGQNKPLRGEVLKASWGIDGGLLLADLDKPRNTTWIPLNKIEAVRFENPGLVGECESVDGENYKLLNLIHPGYGDMVLKKTQNCRD
ncbi:MAG: hypothetical protein H0Z39_10795 [Peptococcaceae bacterium]|nr:hypothetical protein [Peptococcaceae bacterium]